MYYYYAIVHDSNKINKQISIDLLGTLVSNSYWSGTVFCNKLDVNEKSSQLHLFT